MFSSKLWDIILNRSSCHNLYYKFVQWKVNQFGNAEHFAWIKNRHDVINPELYSSGNYCILTIVQVSGATWKKVLIHKNENSESEYIFQNYFFLPSTSIRDENVASWCSLKHVIKSLNYIVSWWRLQTSTKWLDLQFKNSLWVLWFLNGPIQ